MVTKVTGPISLQIIATSVSKIYSAFYRQRLEDRIIRVVPWSEEDLFKIRRDLPEVTEFDALNDTIYLLDSDELATLHSRTSDFATSVRVYEAEQDIMRSNGWVSQTMIFNNTLLDEIAKEAPISSGRYDFLFHTEEDSEYYGTWTSYRDAQLAVVQRILNGIPPGAQFHGVNLI